VAPDRRLATVHTCYTAAVDLDVEFRCWRLKLDTVTVSDRFKPDDLDLTFTKVEATRVSHTKQPSSLCRPR
jgi:hypothetical protein